MKQITEQVRKLSHVEYDVNVWSADETVYVTFYPLRYPGDDGYPEGDLWHGLPVLDTSEFYSLEIPKTVRGPRYRKALEFLKKTVNYDHETMPEQYPAPIWDDVEGMDWWSSESDLSYAPELIADFIASLPRRSQLERFVYGGN